MTLQETNCSFANQFRTRRKETKGPHLETFVKGVCFKVISLSTYLVRTTESTIGEYNDCTCINIKNGFGLFLDKVRDSSVRLCKARLQFFFF